MLTAPQAPWSLLAANGSKQHSRVFSLNLFSCAGWSKSGWRRPVAGHGGAGEGYAQRSTWDQGGDLGEVRDRPGL